MTPSLIQTQIKNRVATIVLNRPAKRNALNSAMLVELERAILTADGDGTVDVIVLTGSDPAFCAGLDMDELGDTGANMVSSDPERQLGPIPPTVKPIIAAVNGPAITGGFEIAMLCDLVVASSKATFGDTHARLGLLPDWGLSSILPHTAGSKKAMEVLLTSQILSAESALKWGLVNAVVPHDELMDRTLAIAQDMIDSDQATLRTILKMQRKIARTTLGDGFAVEAAFVNEAQRGGIDTEKVADRKNWVTKVNRARDVV